MDANSSQTARAHAPQCLNFFIIISIHFISLASELVHISAGKCALAINDLPNASKLLNIILFADLFRDSYGYDSSRYFEGSKALILCFPGI